MKTRFKWIVQSAFVLSFIFVSFLQSNAWAVRCLRPDILTDIEPKDCSEILKVTHKIARIDQLQEGQVEAVAEILGAYPDFELIFLARDGEALYDTLKSLLSQTYPSELSRIHLVNVSRPHIGDREAGAPSGPHDPLLAKYLEQEEISASAVATGKKYLFIDSGYRGTIPSKIAPYFSPVEHKVHLLNSAVPEHPSTRVFLYGMDPDAGRMEAGALHDALYAYEHLPKFYDRSTTFVEEEGKLYPDAPVPVGKIGKDGEVNPEVARLFSENLKFYTTQPTTLAHFQSRLIFWRQFADVVRTNSRERVEALLDTVMSSDDPKKDSIVQDAFEIITRNYKDFPESVPDLTRWGIVPETLPLYYMLGSDSDDKKRMAASGFAYYLLDPMGAKDEIKSYRIEFVVKTLKNIHDPKLKQIVRDILLTKASPSMATYEVILEVLEALKPESEATSHS